MHLYIINIRQFTNYRFLQWIWKQTKSPSARCIAVPVSADGAEDIVMEAVALGSGIVVGVEGATAAHGG